MKKSPIEIDDEILDLGQFIDLIEEIEEELPTDEELQEQFLEHFHRVIYEGSDEKFELKKHCEDKTESESQ